MSEKTYMSAYLPVTTKRRVEKMAQDDHRSVSQQMAWLIEQEHDRRTQPRTSNQRVEYSIGSPEEG